MVVIGSVGCPAKKKNNGKGQKRKRAVVRFHVDNDDDDENDRMELSRQQQLGQQGGRNKKRSRCNRCDECTHLNYDACSACLDRPTFGEVPGRLKKKYGMKRECVTQIIRSNCRKKEMEEEGRALPGTTYVPMKKVGEEEEYSYYCCLENDTPLIVSKKCNVGGKFFFFFLFSLCHTLYIHFAQRILNL